MADDWREQHDAAMAVQNEVFRACRTSREVLLVSAGLYGGLAFGSPNWRRVIEAARANLDEANAPTSQAAE